jgi:hypothetical protein
METAGGQMNADAFTTTPPTEVLQEQLAALITDFNVSTDPAERTALHVGIVRLRSLLELRRAT